MVFGCCEDKDDVRWGLFKRFQEGIKRFLREHVCFVNDIDFITAGSGSKFGILAQLADWVNTSIRGSVHLNDIERTPLRNFRAELTIIARFSCRFLAKLGLLLTVGTIHRFRENAGDRCFPSSPRSPKQIGVANPIR